MDFKVLVAVLMLLQLPFASALEVSLGSLFSTEEERRLLDVARTALFEEQQIEELLSEDVFPAQEEPVYQLQGVVNLTGIVRHADGSYTIWLNGVPVREDDLPPNIALDASAAVPSLRVQVGTESFSLRPGQILEADQRRVRESYEITPEQVQAINAEVQLRAQRMRAVAQRVASRSADDASGAARDQAVPSEEEAMVQSVVEGLRLLQQAQGAQP